MRYKNVIAAVNCNEALIRVHKHSLTLNASASSLLGLNDGDKVVIICDEEGMAVGRNRFYIAKCNSDMHSVTPVRRGRTFVINSQSLSRYMSEKLQGNGTYRICPEDAVVHDGITWYNIYFKNYR